MVSVRTFPSAASSVSMCRSFFSLLALRMSTPSKRPIVQYCPSTFTPARAASRLKAWAREVDFFIPRAPLSVNLSRVMYLAKMCNSVWFSLLPAELGQEGTRWLNAAC